MWFRISPGSLRSEGACGFVGFEIRYAARIIANVRCSPHWQKVHVVFDDKTADRASSVNSILEEKELSEVQKEMKKVTTW